MGRDSDVGGHAMTGSGSHDTPELVVTRAGEVATVTLARPEQRNALSIALRDAVSDALDGLANDQSLKAVAITGAGAVFSAGFDLKEFGVAGADEAFARRLWASSDRFHRTVLEFPLPLLAVVNGPAIAGGFDLAVLCDLRIASTTATFAHPERTFGDVLYGPLHDAVGGAVARELTLGGRILDADEALAVHLVSSVVGFDSLQEEADRWLGRICAAPREVLVRTKAKARRHSGVDPTVPTLEL